MTTKEKEKRRLHKMNVSRKSKMIITMLLLSTLFATVVNICAMTGSLLNHGEVPTLGAYKEEAVIVLWIFFAFVFWGYKKPESELFRELVDCYNASYDSLGKIMLIKKTIKEYRYKEAMSSLERKGYLLINRKRKSKWLLLFLF